MPIEDIIANYDFFNPDGTLNEKYKNYDFQAAINNTTDPVLKEVYKYARQLKVMENPEEYGQYASSLEPANLAFDTAAVAKDKRADALERDRIDSEERISDNALKASTDKDEAEIKLAYDQMYNNNELARLDRESDNENARLDRELEEKRIAAEYGDQDAPVTGYTVEDLSSGFSAKGNGNVSVSAAASNYGVDKTGADVLYHIANLAHTRGGVLTDAALEAALQVFAGDVSEEQLQAVRKYLMVSAGYIPSGGTSSGESWD